MLEVARPACGGHLRALNATWDTRLLVERFGEVMRFRTRVFAGASRAMQGGVILVVKPGVRSSNAANAAPTTESTASVAALRRQTGMCHTMLLARLSLCRLVRGQCSQRQCGVRAADNVPSRAAACRLRRRVPARLRGVRPRQVRHLLRRGACAPCIIDASLSPLTHALLRPSRDGRR